MVALICRGLQRACRVFWSCKQQVCKACSYCMAHLIVAQSQAQWSLQTVLHALYQTGTGKASKF